MNPSASSSSPTPADQRPKLLDQVYATARAKGHADLAAHSIVQASRDFILFHQKKHPKEMGQTEIGQYLEHIV
jgi:hypothetical protein